MSLTPREERGLRIARQEGNVVPRQSDLKDWNVRSESRNRIYIVSLDPPHCECPDFKKRQLPCKHMFAVEHALGRRTVSEERAAPRRTYSQNWPAYNAAQCREKPLFVKLLHDLCQMVRQPEQRRGRPSLPLADMVFAMVYMAYIRFSSRRLIGFLEEAHESDMISKVSCFNSVTRYLSKPEL